MTEDTESDPDADTDSDDTTVENDTRALEAQLREAFGEMTYPVESPADLTAGFRSWANTTFGGTDDLTSARLQVHLPDDPAAHPYESPDALVAAVLEHLEAAGVVTYDEATDRYVLV